MKIYMDDFSGNKLPTKNNHFGNSAGDM